MRHFDVIILGGGPAGCATALSLRQHAHSLSTLLVEGSTYEHPRAGEVLPSMARDLLNQLGILRAFEDQGHRLVYSAAAAWGSQQPFENHFIYSTRGPAWHLDRARFDAFLAREVAQRGVEVVTNVRMREVERVANGWTIRLSDGREVRARFVVDATGRLAAFALKAGARRLAFDRLVAFARFFTVHDKTCPQTLIESFSDGWWYTALAGDRRVVTCLTDVDIARSLALWDRDKWLGLLQETRWIRGVVSGEESGPVITKPASSGFLDPVCGEDWIAVGDAACTYDPLSSQGITKALRSGILASYAIADRLLNSDNRGLVRYQKLIQREFSTYRRTQAHYYLDEPRWPHNPFWRRRQSQLGD